KTSKLISAATRRPEITACKNRVLDRPIKKMLRIMVTSKDIPADISRLFFNTSVKNSKTEKMIRTVSKPISVKIGTVTLQLHLVREFAARAKGIGIGKSDCCNLLHSFPGKESLM